ncbi:MAG: permease [Candidatus Poribacteria bacterium]|nr:MAG: permease [Candidatus Poribacteria bacterium]
MELGAAPRVERRYEWLGIGALLLTAAFWSLNGPLIKLLNAQGQGLGGLEIAFYRSAFGAVLFSPFLWKHRRSLRGAMRLWQLGSVGAFTLMTVSFVVATVQTAAANAIILQYTAPLWVVGLSPWLLQEHVRRTELLVLGLAMVGVGVIFLGNPVTDRLGLTIALISGFGYGMLQITLRGLRSVPPTFVVGANCVGSALLLAPAVGLWGSFRMNGYQLSLMLLMGVVQFAVPYALYSWAVQYVQAARASLIVLLETLLNPLWTYLAVGERVPPATLRGGTLILLAVGSWMVLHWRYERKEVQ